MMDADIAEEPDARSDELKALDAARRKKNPLFKHFASTGKDNEVRCNHCSNCLCKGVSMNL